MPIEIKFTGICENCQQADLELEGTEVESFYGDNFNLWYLHCKHEEVCKKWTDKLFSAEIAPSIKE